MILVKSFLSVNTRVLGAPDCSILWSASCFAPVAVSPFLLKYLPLLPSFLPYFVVEHWAFLDRDKVRPNIPSYARPVERELLLINTNNPAFANGSFCFRRDQF